MRPGMLLLLQRPRRSLVAPHVKLNKTSLWDVRLSLL